jgi:hypothetical protein
MTRQSFHHATMLHLVLAVLAAGALAAIEPKVAAGLPALAEFSAPELYLSSANVPVGEVIEALPNREAWRSYLAERAAQGAAIRLYRSALRARPTSSAPSRSCLGTELAPGHAEELAHSSAASSPYSTQIR